MWAALAFARREFGTLVDGVIAAADSAQTGELVDSPLAAVGLSPVTSASPFDGIPIIGPLIGIFWSDGTADNPNAGLLFGNGFSYDASTCAGTTACNGGRGGLWFGSGGNGFAHASPK